MSDIVWTPTQEHIAKANVTRLMKQHGLKTYDDLIAWSQEDIGRFWHACNEDLGLEWYTPYETVMDESKGLPWSQWFLGGRLNIVHNTLDRHQANREDHPALVCIPDQGVPRTLTYSALHDEVSRAAGALRALGVQRGDAVAIYMPMIPEMVMAFFACLKIGAAVVPIFSGFGASALATRLRDARVKVLFTADVGFRRGKSVPIKQMADNALAEAPSVKYVVVVTRGNDPTPWQERRDTTWQDFMRQGERIPTEKLDAEDTALILYTSGTTGRPKGTVHTHAGCQLQMAKELAYYFDVRPDSRFFWVTDIGWMMGPWELIGVMTFGGTVTIFEGAPDFPQPDRLWEIVEDEQISHLGISPTAVRLLKSYGDEWVSRHDLSSLRILGSTGEPWDPESYQWFFETVGKKRCPIINISGGTEIVGCLLAPLPITELKSCSLRGPGLGMAVDVYNEDGKSIRQELGYLVCKKPAPSMTKGFLNDRQRYLDTYFSKWPNTWNHGDWAFVDKDGHWFLRGRADDTIKIAGRRTGPAEIEAALIDHPAVMEAAAIGIPHDIKGQELVCFVVLENGQAVTDQLPNQLKEQVVRAMGKALTPREVYIVSSLPKTRSAKIVRGIILKKYLGQELGDTASVENPASIEAIPTAERN